MSAPRAEQTEQAVPQVAGQSDLESETESVEDDDHSDEVTAEQLRQLAALAPSVGEPSMGVPTTRLSGDELCRLGQEIYNRDLKPRLEPAHNGQYVVVHVVNGDYFVDADEVQAFLAARTKYPADLFFIRRIGFLDRL